MGKWLDLISNEDLMNFAIDNYGTYWCDVERVDLNGVGKGIKITSELDNGDTYSVYFDDFFEISYDYKTQKFHKEWHDSLYINKDHLKWTDFDDDDDLIQWVDFMVLKFKEKGLDHKQYIKEFKEAYIKEFDLKNKNNNRTKLIKKLFNAIDERQFEQKDELTL